MRRKLKTTWYRLDGWMNIALVGWCNAQDVRAHLTPAGEANKHTAKRLPTVTLGKERVGKQLFAECFFSCTGKESLCYLALGKKNWKKIKKARVVRHGGERMEQG